MDPESQQGGGGIMSGKIMGMPSLVFVALVAAAAYFLFFRNKSTASAGGTSDAGSSDTLTSGATTVDTGAVQVTVNAGGSGDAGGGGGGGSVSGGGSSGGGSSGGGSSPGGGNPQPSPPQPTGTATVTVPNITGERGEAGKDILAAAGLKLKQSPPGSPKGKTTTIISQNPKGGAKVAKGTTVSDVIRVNK
jgi:PASTA domain